MTQQQQQQRTYAIVYSRAKAKGKSDAQAKSTATWACNRTYTADSFTPYETPEPTEPYSNSATFEDLFKGKK